MIPILLALLLTQADAGVPQEKPLAWPIHGRVTSEYGYRESDCMYHNGLDIAAKVGTPIRAAAKGRIYYSKESKDPIGNFVYIYHKSIELYTLYGHLSKIAVRDGQKVRKGQVIGYVGLTGKTTGPHLHFTVEKGDEQVSVTVDPRLYLP